MHIRVNTDRNIEGSDRLASNMEAIVRDAIARFADRITRVEMHLSDENSRDKGGTADKRCLLEARLAGLRPVVVSHVADSVEQAVDGAAEKLARSLDHTLGRLESR